MKYLALFEDQYFKIPVKNRDNFLMHNIELYLDDTLKEEDKIEIFKRINQLPDADWTDYGYDIKKEPYFYLVRTNFQLYKRKNYFRNKILQIQGLNGSYIDKKSINDVISFFK